MRSAKLHSRVDIFHTGNALCINADSFINHRNQYSVYHKSRCFLHFHRCLADFCCDGLNLLHQISRCIGACNDFHQLHSVCRIEEMHADHGSVQSCADFRNGKRRCIRSKYALRLNNFLQFLKCSLLNLHIFRRNLNHQIAIRTNILQTGYNFCGNSIRLGLCQLLLAYQEHQILHNTCLAAVSKLLLNITQTNLIAFCHGKCLRNSGSHCTCTDNTYLH